MSKDPSLPDPVLPPPQRRIFCNRTLNLRAIRAIGLDMDYTLIRDRAEVWEERAYSYVKARLLERGWPVAALAFDPEHPLLTLRGLHVRPAGRSAGRGAAPPATGYRELYGVVKTSLDEAHMEGRLKEESRGLFMRTGNDKGTLARQPAARQRAVWRPRGVGAQNWWASVDSESASVELLPPLITSATRSK